MTAARVASPEGWQVSVGLVGGSWGSVLGAGGLVLGGAGGRKPVAESSLVDGPRGGQGVVGVARGAGLVVAAADWWCKRE